MGDGVEEVQPGGVGCTASTLSSFTSDQFLTPFSADGTLKVHPKFFKDVGQLMSSKLGLMPWWRFGPKLFAHTSE